MSALVQISDGVARTSSINVAASFEKRHNNVLRAIRQLMGQSPDLALNFEGKVQQIEIGSGSSRGSRYYEMDRKGFTLLAMGFTGPKALEWKIAYIDAFDRMEAALRALEAEAPERPAPPAVAPAEEMRFIDRMRYEPPTVQLAYVREMRMARGRPGAIMAMRDLGWEDAGEGAVASLPDFGPGADAVVSWARERMVPTPGARVRTTALYDDFAQWCAGGGRPAVTLPVFGRALGAMGYPPLRSNGMWREGLGFRAPH